MVSVHTLSINRHRTLQSDAIDRGAVLYHRLDHRQKCAIDLIEMRFAEWYIEREKRTRRLAEITALSAQKARELEKAKLEKLSPSFGPASP